MNDVPRDRKLVEPERRIRGVLHDAKNQADEEQRKEERSAEQKLRTVPACRFWSQVENSSLFSVRVLVE